MQMDTCLSYENVLFVVLKCALRNLKQVRGPCSHEALQLDHVSTKRHAQLVVGYSGSIWTPQMPSPSTMAILM